MVDFKIDNDYKDDIFKLLCTQRAIAIFHAESKEIIAILRGVSLKAIINACSKSQSNYIIRFLSILPTYIKYPFLDDVVTHIAGNRIRHRLKELVEGWTA